MKIYAPEYYKDFSCIADRCRHSCCVGWEIDIDGQTHGIYRELSADYGEKIRESIEEGEVPHFRLSEDERCPHLDERGLCRIITCLGEGYLCSICREHPRFYNRTRLGTEAGLGMVCEEACRIILSSDGYSSFSVIGEEEGEDIEAEFDAVGHRQRIFDILSDRTVEYKKRLCTICSEYKKTPSVMEDGEWREVLSSLEYLSEEHRELFSVYSSFANTPTEIEIPLERALAYFVYRHCSSALCESEFLASLGFSLFCERLLCSLVNNNPGIPIENLARIVSEELEYSEENTESIKMEFIW